MNDHESTKNSQDMPDAPVEDSAEADVRLVRITQHIDRSLKMDDPLQACIGATSGDQMLMQYRLGQALEESLKLGPDSIAALAEVMPAMNTYMKLSQQVDRSIQLSLKIQAAKKVE